MAERMTSVDHGQGPNDLTSYDETEPEVSDPLPTTDEGEEVEG